MGNKKATFTVSWVIKEEGKQLIKFVEDPDNSYSYADPVLKYVQSIKDGDVVDVEIDTDNVVVKVSTKQNTEEKNDEKTVESKPAVVGNEQTRTVKAVMSSKEVLLFVSDEAEKIWTVIPEELRDSINIADVKGKDVNVVLKTESINGKDAQVLVSLELVDAPQSNEEVKTESKAKSFDNNQKSAPKNATGNSIEAQASMKSANLIVSNIVDKDTTPEETIKRIKKIAEANFDLIQELKNRKL